MLVAYFCVTALCLFGLLVANRVVHFEFMAYIIILNFISMICVSVLLKRKVVALVVGGVVILGSPAYYFNAYTNIKDVEAVNFQILISDAQTFKFFSEGKAGNFILIEAVGDDYVCYGPYQTNSTECKRLGSKLRFQAKGSGTL